MAWPRGLPWTLVGVLLSSGCAARSERINADTFNPLCTVVDLAPFDHAGEVLAELTRQGLKPVDCGCSLGEHDIAVEGAWREAYRAREVIRRWALERVRPVLWPADYFLLPEKPDTWSMARHWETPSWSCVARVVDELTPSPWVVQILQGDGYRPMLFFGSSADLVFVPREEATGALELLDRHPLVGVRLYPRLPRDR